MHDKNEILDGNWPGFLEFDWNNFEHVKTIILRSILIFLIHYVKKWKKFLVNLKNWDNARNYLSSVFKVSPYRL